MTIHIQQSPTEKTISLFPEPNSGAVKITLVPDGWMLYNRQFIKHKQSRELLDYLRSQIKYTQPTIRMFGRTSPQPRLISLVTEDPSITYRYSGQTLHPLHVFNQLPLLNELLMKVKQRFDCPKLNAVLINWYRNGQDYMGFHADDERELGHQPRIVSVSVGAERDFVVKSRSHQGRDKVKIRLANGSGLLMAGGMQTHWLHGVPRRAGVTNDRINLTFRYICQ